MKKRIKLEKIHAIFNDFASSNEDSVNQTKIKLKSIPSDELLYYIWSKEPTIRNVPAMAGTKVSDQGNMERVQVVSDKEEEETIELYRVMVDTVIANEHRRQQISSVFITLIAAGFGAAGAIKDFELLYVTTPAMFVSIVWWAQVRFLKRLATAKFHVIGMLEERLSYQPFKEEWCFLKRQSSGEARTWFRIGLSQIEMTVPLAIFVACLSHIGFEGYSALCR